uniref:DUF19 domain-containing protein n=1 Tax=Panagrellus redivivus TaxID=6233 RepID=A0A7E4VJ02_PANRE
MQVDLQNMEEMPNPSNGAFSFSQFLQKSKSKEIMPSFFKKICKSYETADACLADCEARSRNGVNIRQTYAGLRFICKDMREDFFNALPCLFEYEPVAMAKCQNELNQSHITTAQFTESIINRELHAIRSRFRTLCIDLSVMIGCMEPVIREGCGDAPTNMMLKFITLEFSSFERLYGQLGFAEPLPSPCRSLLAMPAPRPPGPDRAPSEAVYPSHTYATYSNSVNRIFPSGILISLSLVNLIYLF